jgi:hypothetical protein
MLEKISSSNFKGKHNLFVSTKIRTQVLVSFCIAVYIFVVVCCLVHFAKIATMDPLSRFLNLIYIILMLLTDFVFFLII